MASFWRPFPIFLRFWRTRSKENQAAEEESAAWFVFILASFGAGRRQCIPRLLALVVLHPQHAAEAVECALRLTVVQENIISAAAVAAVFWFLQVSSFQMLTFPSPALLFRITTLKKPPFCDMICSYNGMWCHLYDFMQRRTRE